MLLVHVPSLNGKSQVCLNLLYFLRRRKKLSTQTFFFNVVDDILFTHIFLLFLVIKKL
jgi:hypothetical protein